MMDTTYNVGIYCRLSNDDERDGESVSIENQKLLLQNYVRQRGWNEVDVYIDDGYSGTNFNRPGVRRLIEDAKAKRINVILVKDLSRFGRNYIEFGQYTDYLFPSLGCRFIALNNGIDTMSDNGSTDVMCFLNLFNEFYSRDTSKKVKAVKKACAENGKFMGTYPAYGYRRDPLDKHHLVIDEETAPVVRRIFEMRASGMGFHAIAVALNEEGIQPPGVLYYQRKGQSDPRRVNHKWADQTVKNMVRNEVYIGNMVQGKSGTLSYKSRKLVNKSEDEWIRVEGTHEAIISRELWDTVASIGKKKVRKSAPSDGCKSIFTGLVYCADCGFKMRNHIEKFTYKDGRPGRYSSFICGNYSRSGRGACTIHTIYETVLTQLVLEDIREKARFAEYDPDRLMGEILRLKEKESHTRLFSYEQELKSSLARISDLERLMQNLYEDKCTGSIPQTVFQTLMQKYEAERAEKAEAVPELERKVRAHLENQVDTDRWLEIIRRYTEISELDETILFELVDRIEVGDTQKVNGQRICEVKVYYRYVGNVDGALAQERGQDYGEAI
ncbi:recombinase family protein [Flavonifractor plautii]|uniref:recombinase family protein n=1 Tax=Flavonifractor plautii TaxID=292800 RepID=UPI00214AEED9|nr:recombinase family protein [Flavonifractor plautii]MCR1909498.1 recombinase family protein [Flavonifractor plautii]